MLDTMLKNHIIELHNQEMDYQLRKQSKLIEELNEVIISQKKILKENGIHMDDLPVIANDDNELMEEEFDNNSNYTEMERNAEGQLVEQLEDFETMRDNIEEDVDNDIIDINENGIDLDENINIENENENENIKESYDDNKIIEKLIDENKTLNDDNIKLAEEA
jgi:uncharacterized coiled-coil protein SlyX